MKHYENHQIEEKLYKDGYKLIAGTDEVGRGPLAGPVVASAVIMPVGCYIEGVTDSKKVSQKNRYLLKKAIEENAIAIATIFIDENTIDKINILEASRLAMTKAIEQLNPAPDYVITDAMKLSLNCPTEAIIKGDEKSFTIGCASIIAKIARDEYMDELDKQYPQYDFKSNKGYPTKKHLEALKKHGITPVHRKSYGPVADIIINQNNIKD